MNHELVMLRGAMRMKKNAKEIETLTRKLAVKSYMTNGWVAETEEQATLIANYTLERDKLMNFYNAVESALKITPKGVGALLNQVYVHRADKDEMCKRYKVSRSTLYRKLAFARKSFRHSLERLGYDEGWFKENYADIDWIAVMLEKDASCGRLSE